MIEKLKNFANNILDFDNKYAKYIITFSFIMMIIGSVLKHSEFYNASNLLSLIGLSSMAGLLTLAILNLIIVIIIKNLKGGKKQ